MVIVKQPHRSIWAQLVSAFSLPVAWGGCEMSKTPSSRVRRVAALFATVLSCLLPPRAFSYTRNQPLVTSSPSGIQNHMPPTFGNSNAQFGLTGRAAVPEKYVAPRDFGGKHAEALFTAMVAGLAAYAMSHGSRNDAPKTMKVGKRFFQEPERRKWKKWVFLKRNIPIFGCLGFYGY